MYTICKEEKSGNIYRLFSFNKKSFPPDLFQIADNQSSIVSIWENPNPYLGFDDSSPESELTTDELMAEDQNVALSILEDNYYPFHDYYFHARNDNDEPITDLEQLITIFVIKQFWDHIKEAIIPYIVSNTRLSFLIQLSKKEHTRYTERKDLNDELKRILDQWNTSKQTKPVDDILIDSSFNPRDTIPSFETLSLSQAEIECLQPKWPDLYEDYLELVIQFGSSKKVLPEAFFSLINNILEIRTDAFKLCMIYQRPFSQRVKDIGHWQKIMEYMIVAAIIVNCIFCSIRGVFRRLVPRLPFAAEIFLLICIEHLLVLFCKIIRSSIENVPYWVRVEKAKMEYRRREALKKLECDALHLKETHCHVNED
ncbi:unnamed protein product [Adineta steineri]|uniref:Anoctamin n=1 Tax=Adineta steineri TaxID=433720 RepID=A0A815R8D0_9BILA|nr:unnamed protein product [Adineta steineri]